ncbi:uncharacterized protein PAE49_018438 [Odontesthes bonariensis]
MSAQPPPYRPFFPEGPASPVFPPAFCTQPAAFPGSAYQTFPQNATGGDHAYYHPGHAGRNGALGRQPGYHGNKHEAQHPPNTVYVVEPRRDQDDGVGSYLAACSAALCCCCLWDLLHR